MKIENAPISNSLKSRSRGRLAFGAAMLAFLASSAGAFAQQDPVNGAVGGAAQGTYEGKKAAGPVGGLVGGALGAGVGAVTGTLNGVLGATDRVIDPAPVPPPPTSSSTGYYDSRGVFHPN